MAISHLPPRRRTAPFFVALCLAAACDRGGHIAPPAAGPPPPVGGGGTGGTPGATPPAPADAGSPDAAPGGIDEPDPPSPPAPDGGAPVTGPAPPASPKVPTPSPACGSGKPAPAQGYHDLMVGTAQRRFILRLPAAYDGKKPWPVIFAFHGAGGQDATTFDTKFGFKAANGDKAVLLFGEALPRPQGGRSWMVDTAANMAYIDAVIAWLQANVCIDSSKLFATGQSSGGFFSQTLGCQRGHVFRAIASSSGGWRDFDNCMGNPGVWMSHGKADSAPLLADVAKATAYWFMAKGCSMANPRPVDPAPCVAYDGCKDGVPFVTCTHGGGHPWPPYATKGVWTFFSQFGP